MPHRGKRPGARPVTPRSLRTPGPGWKKTGQTRMRKRRAPVQAEDVLADSSFDERKAWLSLLKATTNSTGVGEDGKRKQVTVPDNRIRLAALKYLTDRRDGKAASFVHPGAVNTALQPLEDSRLVVRIPSRDRGQCKTSGEDIQRAGGA